MESVGITGDTTLTGTDSSISGTTDVIIGCNEHDYSTSWTYSIYTYPAECDREYHTKHKKIQAVRIGWFNPQKIQLPNKPIINDIRKVCRNALPEKIRQMDYVA